MQKLSYQYCLLHGLGFQMVKAKRFVYEGGTRPSAPPGEGPGTKPSAPPEGPWYKTSVPPETPPPKPEKRRENVANVIKNFSQQQRYELGKNQFRPNATAIGNELPTVDEKIRRGAVQGQAAAFLRYYQFESDSSKIELLQKLNTALEGDRIDAANSTTLNDLATALENARAAYRKTDGTKVRLLAPILTMHPGIKTYTQRNALRTAAKKHANATLQGDAVKYKEVMDLIKKSAAAEVDTLNEKTGADDPEATADTLLKKIKDATYGGFTEPPIPDDAHR